MYLDVVSYTLSEYQVFETSASRVSDTLFFRRNIIIIVIICKNVNISVSENYRNKCILEKTAIISLCKPHPEKENYSRN